MVNYKILEGNCLEVLKTLPDKSIDCCVTSPPYYNLRDYGVEGQIGNETTPEEYVDNLVNVFKEVFRVLKDEGTFWLNIGDTFNGNKTGNTNTETFGRNGGVDTQNNLHKTIYKGAQVKELLGIPWMVAFALKQSGWMLRQDIIWAKPNPMPESVTDRFTKSHEYIFFFTKQPNYYFDHDAVQEDSLEGTDERKGGKFGGNKYSQSAEYMPGHTNGIYSGKQWVPNGKRNKRDVWNIGVNNYAGAHFATFPTKLIEPCILAGCPVGGTVLDPFNGSATTGEVSLENDRNYIGIELNPEYVNLSVDRLEKVLHFDSAKDPIVDNEGNKFSEENLW